MCVCVFVFAFVHGHTLFVGEKSVMNTKLNMTKHGFVGKTYLISSWENKVKLPATFILRKIRVFSKIGY